MGKIGYYPQQRHRLERTLDSLLADSPDRDLSPQLLIAPHGPLPDTGTILARTYSALDLDRKRTAVILGGSHADIGPGLATTDTTFTTPLGDVAVDSMFTQQLTLRQVIDRSEEAFENEVFIEMQLLFLQHLLDNLQVVPIKIANTTQQQQLEKVTEIIQEALRPSDLLIVSSNLSQIGREADRQALLDEVKRNDSRFINILRKQDTNALQATGDELGVCGWRAIQAGLQCVPQADNFHMLAHTTGYVNPSIKEQAVGFGGFCYT